MVNAPPPPSWSSQQQVATITGQLGAPAGFWIRFVAYIVDGFVLGLAAGVIFVIIVGLNVVLGGWNGEDADVIIWLSIVLGVVAFFATAWLYEALMTSGPYGATIGKQAVGVRIVRADGAQLSFGRATGRHFCKVLATPMVPFGIGYLMAAFTSGKRALHDIIADTFVIKSR